MEIALEKHNLISLESLGLDPENRILDAPICEGCGKAALLILDTDKAVGDFCEDTAYMIEEDCITIAITLDRDLVFVRKKDNVEKRGYLPVPKRWDFKPLICGLIEDMDDENVPFSIIQEVEPHHFAIITE